jgi:hypothetical protein
MATVYEIEKIMSKVKVEKMRLKKELSNIINSTTVFKRFTKEKTECSAKIDILTNMEEWLATELRRAKLLEETN